MRYFPFIIILIFFIGCSSNSPEEDRAEAIESAKILLNRNKCQEAIDTLEAAGRDDLNAEYLITLSSAYACKAGYDTPTFFGTNLPNIPTNLSGVFGALTTFTTSRMTSPTDAQYLDLQTAINLLLHAGGLNTPSAANRALRFTSEEASDMNMLLIFYILTQMGKYLYYYGNVNPLTGAKGEGSLANGNPNRLVNVCLYTYDPPVGPIQIDIDASYPVGECVNPPVGHTKMEALPNAETITRMCQGVVLFNNLLDSITNVTLPGNVDTLETMKQLIEELCSGITILSNAAICNTLGQTECEQDFDTHTSRTEILQYFIFKVYESNFP